MALAALANTFEEALSEVKAYQRMGALTDQVLSDIAFDYNVDEAELREAFEND